MVCADSIGTFPVLPEEGSHVIATVVALDERLSYGEATAGAEEATVAVTATLLVEIEAEVFQLVVVSDELALAGVELLQLLLIADNLRFKTTGDLTLRHLPRANL